MKSVQGDEIFQCNATMIFQNMLQVEACRLARK